MKHILVAATAGLFMTGAAVAGGLQASPLVSPDFVSATSAYDWNGLYAGVTGGYSWGRASVRDDSPGVEPGPFGYDVHGPLVGVTFGYNSMNNNVLFGVEGSLAYLGSSGAGVIGSSHDAQHQDLTLDSGILGDLTGRLGVSLGNTLFYAKGGAAFFTGKAQQATTNPNYAPTGTGTFVGLAIGAGVEQAISSNTTIKVEYEHFDFGEQHGYQTALQDDLPTPAGYKFDNYTKLGFDQVKVGLNVKF